METSWGNYAHLRARRIAPAAHAASCYTRPPRFGKEDSSTKTFEQALSGEFFDL